MMKAMLALGTLMLAAHVSAAPIYSDKQATPKSANKIQLETTLAVTNEYSRGENGRAFANESGKTVLIKKTTGTVNGVTKTKTDLPRKTEERYLLGDMEITGRTEIQLSFGNIPVTMNAAITRDERNRVVAVDVSETAFAKAYLEAMLKSEKGNRKNLNAWLSDVAANDLAVIRDGRFTERRIETTGLSCKNSAKGLSCKFTLSTFAEVFEK